MFVNTPQVQSTNWRTTMKIMTLFLMFGLSLATSYAQSTINHQGHATVGDHVVTGTGTIDLPASNTSWEIYKRSVMSRSEDDAMEKCHCGTRSIYECLERVSDWTVYKTADRPMFPSKWMVVAVAQYKCF
jgi:hypothetical protein